MKKGSDKNNPVVSKFGVVTSKDKKIVDKLTKPVIKSNI